MNTCKTVAGRSEVFVAIHTLLRSSLLAGGGPGNDVFLQYTYNEKIAVAQGTMDGKNVINE